jgi:transposase InsO family protein
VIDAYARRIVGWRASQDLGHRQLRAGCPGTGDPRSAGPAHSGGLIHHNDRGSQYVSINYTERLAEAEERYYAMLDEQPMAA